MYQWHHDPQFLLPTRLVLAITQTTISVLQPWAQCRRLLEEHYPWFLKTYDALPKPIMRADAIRSFYMHRYGVWTSSIRKQRQSHV